MGSLVAAAIPADRSEPGENPKEKSEVVGQIHLSLVSSGDVPTDSGSSEKMMNTEGKMMRTMLLMGVMLAICAVEGRVFAQKASVPKPQDKLALGDNEVRQLMLLIDTNNNGKITKKEWMTFMEAEFDRLDKNKSGELDPKELAASRLQVSHFLSAGK